MATYENYIITGTLEPYRKYLEISGVGRTQESWLGPPAVLKADQTPDVRNTLRRFYLPINSRLFQSAKDLLLDQMTDEPFAIDRFARIDRDLILWKGKAFRISNISTQRQSHHWDYEARPFIDNRSNIYFDLIVYYETGGEAYYNKKC
jgi:hypothetical protein